MARGADVDSLPHGLPFGDPCSSFFNNRLTSIPGSILSGMRICTRMSLWINSLMHVPPEIGHMENLQELWLYRNQLTEIPPEIGRLKLLKRLWV
jgi:internalin A